MLPVGKGVQLARAFAFFWSVGVEVLQKDNEYERTCVLLFYR